MEENKKEEIKNAAIPYTEDTILKEGQKYINCNIEFIYDSETNKEKPYLLNNGYRLNHIPTGKDTGINNFINIEDRSPEERKAITSKGGINSAISQAKRRTFKESIELFLSLSVSTEQLERINSSIIDKIPEDIKQHLTQADLITLKNIELSQDGSEKHSVFLRDTVGEKPTDKQEISAEIITEADRSLMEKLEKRLNKTE